MANLKVRPICIQKNVTALHVKTPSKHVYQNSDQQIITCTKGASFLSFSNKTNYSDKQVFVVSRSVTIELQSPKYTR